MRVDHFKLDLPNVRFEASNNSRDLYAYVASILQEGNEDIFAGQPHNQYSTLKLNNEDWHFTSKALRIKARPMGNGIYAAYCSLKLDLNFTRFYAHHSVNANFRKKIRREPVRDVMRRDTSMRAELSAIALNDSDNIILGGRYDKTRAIGLMGLYLRSVFGLFEQVFDEEQSDDSFREAIADDGTALLSSPRQRDLSPRVDRNGFYIRDAEFYIDFQHANAIACVKRIGTTLKRIARDVVARQYSSSIESYIGEDDELHCYSYRVALNSGRNLKIYAKTTTRVRIEVSFPKSIRQHIKNVNHGAPIEQMKALFQRGAEIATADIAALLRELTKHQRRRKKEKRVTPLVFSRFMHAVAIAANGDIGVTQKIIGELLDKQSVRAGNDPQLKVALRYLQQEGVLEKTGIEKRITKPVYVLSEAYDQIILHLVERGKKLKLVKKLPRN